MRDLMIDLETLGTGPDAVILSIGAVFFDITGKKLGRDFYMVLNVQEQLDAGRQVEASTLKWWIGQDAKAKNVFEQQQTQVVEALEAFAHFYRLSATGPNDECAYVWGNGSNFDISMLEHIYRSFGFPVPWAYNKPQDLRTFKRFYGPYKKVQNLGTAHNALDDAKAQAQFVLDNT